MQIVELSDVNLRMLGHHQLQNAVTATCVSLCLRDQGIMHFWVSISSNKRIEQAYKFCYFYYGI